MRPSAGGRKPDSRFCARLRYSNDAQPPNASGMPPSRRLHDRSSVSRRRSFPRVAGMTPPSSLWWSTSSRRFVREPTVSGKNPLSRFPKRFSPTTRPARADTPNQRDTSTSVAAQPSFHSQDPGPSVAEKSSCNTHHAGGLPIQPVSCFQDWPSRRSARSRPPLRRRTEASTAAFDADSHMRVRASGGHAVSKRARSMPLT